MQNCFKQLLKFVYLYFQDGGLQIALMNWSNDSPINRGNPQGYEVDLPYLSTERGLFTMTCDFATVNFDRMVMPFSVLCVHKFVIALYMYVVRLV